MSLHLKQILEMPLIRSRFYHWLPNVADLTYVVIQGPAQVIRLWHEVKKKTLKLVVVMAAVQIFPG